MQTPTPEIPYITYILNKKISQLETFKQNIPKIEKEILTFAFDYTKPPSSYQTIEAIIPLLKPFEVKFLLSSVGRDHSLRPFSEKQLEVLKLISGNLSQKLTNSKNIETWLEFKEQSAREWMLEFLRDQNFDFGDYKKK